MITSTTNPKVKRVKRLQTDRRFRKRERAYVVEGIRWLRDLQAMAQLPTLICYTARWEADPLIVQSTAPKVMVSDAVMAEMSDVETPPGVLMVVSMRDVALPDRPNFLLILDAIQTPGNLGTMLRTAAAAGVDGVLLAPGCVDPFNPKVLRGSMGAHLRLAVISAEWPQIATLTNHLTVYSAVIHSDQPYTSVDWQQPSALIIGNEANGIGLQAEQLTTGITIPMASKTESLNAAIACGIILFEAARQRHNKTVSRSTYSNPSTRNFSRLSRTF